MFLILRFLAVFHRFQSTSEPHILKKSSAFGGSLLFNFIDKYEILKRSHGGTTIPVSTTTNKPPTKPRAVLVLCGGVVTQEW